MTLEDFIILFRSKEEITKGKCFYCGIQTNKAGKEHHRQYQTRDHVIPRSGGAAASSRQSQANRVICCRKCNANKEDLTLHEFKRKSGMAVFYSEQLLEISIDVLDDIEIITNYIMTNRKIEGRVVKFDGKREVRTLPNAMTMK
jgi:hypothetical protein